MSYYFISDLHLEKNTQTTINNFVTFLQDIQDEAVKLYILGDFVNYWVGDDNGKHGLDKAFDALKTFAENCPVYFMHGNRDFLIGEKFIDKYNLKFIEDPCSIQINSHKITLTHGDLLCTDDEEYTAFRKQVRSPEWQTAFLQKSLSDRIQIVENLRTQSQLAMSEKAEYLMDVNQAAVENYFNKYKVNTIIHGHTHKCAIHEHIVNNKHCQRIVLSDWHDMPSYLKIKDNNAELVCDSFIKSTTLIQADSAVS